MFLSLPELCPLRYGRSHRETGKKRVLCLHLGRVCSPGSGDERGLRQNRTGSSAVQPGSGGKSAFWEEIKKKRELFFFFKKKKRK